MGFCSFALPFERPPARLDTPPHAFSRSLGIAAATGIQCSKIDVFHELGIGPVIEIAVVVDYAHCWQVRCRPTGLQ
jgi:hypothetical protein